MVTVLVDGVNMAPLPLVDRMVGRPLLLLGIGGMLVSLAVLGYLFGAQHASRVAILAGVLVFLACFAIGLGPVFRLLISEI